MALANGSVLLGTTIPVTMHYIEPIVTYALPGFTDSVCVFKRRAGLRGEKVFHTINTQAIQLW